jgi:hypothetical protein
MKLIITWFILIAIMIAIVDITNAEDDLTTEEIIILEDDAEDDFNNGLGDNGDG